MKRRNRLFALCLCFALLLGCLPTVSAAEYLKSDELEEFIIASVATGQIERDEIEKIIDNMIASGRTDPEDWKKCVNATIKARATIEYARKVALEQGIDYTPAKAVAAEQAELDALEELKNELIASGRVEQDKLENYINKLISMGITEPDDQEKYIMASIEAKEAKEEIIQAMKDQGLDPSYYAPLLAEAAEETEADALEELKNNFIASGRIEQDELESYINKLTALGITEPDKLEDFINAYITDKEMREEERKEVLKYAAEVDEEVRAKICGDYYAQHELLHGYTELEDVFIRKYYGCYNGVHVVRMDVLGMAYTTAALDLSIDGILFHFSSTSCEAMFLAYKDGEFIQVADAYEQGLLTKSNLISMLPIHYENYKHLPFRDVDNGGWYEDAAWYVFLNGLFTGVSSYRFAPEDTLSRAMLATVLWRSQGEPAVHPSTYFTDVEEGSWYAEAVAWADRQLIVFGTGNRKFSPNDPVTRETFATMLYRMSGADEASPEKAPDFKDLSTVSSWAKDAVDWAIDEEILQGIEQEDGLYLAPTRPITRAEAAAMLMRYMDGTSPDMKAVDLMEDYYPQIIDPNSSMTEESMEAIADFSVSLFQKTVSEEENTVMSPLSVLYALTMLTNGAEGRTLEELEQTLGLSREDLNQAMYLLRSALNDRFCNVNVANSIWIRDGFAVAPEFLRENAKWLDADAYQAPYDDSTVEDMNNWISHNTDGMIEDMVQELSPETVLTLINALLFQSDWSDPYQGTREAPFYRADGTVETADMLRGSEYLYLQDDMATGFRKSFDSRKYDFAVIVPNEGVSLEEYIAQMDGASLRTMLQGEVYDAVYTTMPAFSAEFTTEMSTILKEMGIRDAFAPNHADLSGIAEDLYVSNVTHKAVIEVEESGVSAGAATIVDIAPTAPVIEKTATVTADRPYLYMIIDTETNLPLFMGTTLTVA